jgi:hypothetical protein
MCADARTAAGQYEMLLAIMKTIRRFSVGAVAAAVMLGMAGCSGMSAGGQDTVGGVDAGGFIGYQLVKSK